MGMVSTVGFGERAGIRRHRKTMLAKRSRRMLNFLFQYGISTDLKIHPAGMTELTFDEAIFATDYLCV